MQLFRKYFIKQSQLNLRIPPNTCEIITLNKIGKSFECKVDNIYEKCSKKIIQNTLSRCAKRYQKNVNKQ